MIASKLGKWLVQNNVALETMALCGSTWRVRFEPVGKPGVVAGEGEHEDLAKALCAAMADVERGGKPRPFEWWRDDVIEKTNATRAKSA